MHLKEAAPHADPSCMGDRGDIVLGWLTKLVGTLAVLGIVGFDLISLGSARFSADGHAQTAAREAGAMYKSSKDIQAAYEAAVSTASEHGDTIDPQTFTVTPEGAVTLTLTRVAPTLVIAKIPQARHWAEVEVTTTSRTAS